MKSIKKQIIFLFFFLGLAAVFAPAQAAAAARLYLDPASGSYDNNGEFTVDVWVDPAGKDVQAIDMIINFDKTRLEATKAKIVDDNYFKYGSSVFNVDNATGEMKLYSFSSQGSYSKNTKGKVVSITFTAKSEGTAAVNFVCGSAAGGSAIRNINEDNFIDCSANGSGSYAIGAASVGGTAIPTSAPAPTATPAQLPETGFSLAGWGLVSLGGSLLGAGLIVLLF